MLAAGVIGYGARLLVADAHRFVVAGVSLGAFGVAYLGLTLALRVGEASGLLRRLRRVRG